MERAQSRIKAATDKIKNGGDENNVVADDTVGKEDRHGHNMDINVK